MGYVGYTAVNPSLTKKLKLELPLTYDLPERRDFSPKETSQESVSDWKKAFELVLYSQLLVENTEKNKVVNTSNNKFDISSYVPLNGDVVEINNTNHKYGHTAVYWNGSWYSDFKLNKMDPYSDGKSTYRIFRNPNNKEAEAGAQEVARKAGNKSTGYCAKAVRQGFLRIAGNKYKGESYNGKEFGTYLNNKGWVRVAKNGLKINDWASYESTYNNHLEHIFALDNLYDLPKSYKISNFPIRNKQLIEGLETDWRQLFYNYIKLSNENHTETLDYSGPLNVTNTQFETAYNKLEQRNSKAKSRRKFFTKLAGLETGGTYKYNAKNLRTGASGWFLLMPRTLKDVSSISIEDYLNNGDALMDAAMKLYDLFLNSFTEKDKQTAKKLGYSELALVAGAWLGGPGGVRAFLYKGLNRSDGGTTIKKRMDLFNNI